MNYNNLPAQQKKFVKIRVLNIHYLKIIADQNQKKIGIESFENPFEKSADTRSFTILLRI